MKFGIVRICKYCVVLYGSFALIECVSLEGSADYVTYCWLGNPGVIKHVFFVSFCPDGSEVHRLPSQCVKTTRT
jgi:hypothetical protein